MILRGGHLGKVDCSLDPGVLVTAVRKGLPMFSPLQYTIWPWRGSCVSSTPIGITTYTLTSPYYTQDIFFNRNRGRGFASTCGQEFTPCDDNIHIYTRIYNYQIHGQWTLLNAQTSVFTCHIILEQAHILQLPHCTDARGNLSISSSLVVHSVQA